jgi:hypothetical protein
MKNVSAADTVVFEFGRRWFMLTNICSADIGDHNSELHMFSSDSPLSDDWKANRNNPIIFDSTKARNGGLFKLDGVLYRVNQIHKMNHYGRAFGINRILNVDEDSYEEEEICRIEPDFFKGSNSTHHFHANGAYCVFDHNRMARL